MIMCAGALLMPYSLVVIPEIDRIVSTNSSMHDEDIFSGVTYQVWRLSDLKLLKTSFFDVGDNLYAHISPEEPRLGTPYESAADRTYLLKLDETTGAISVDTDFRDTDGKPAFSFAERDWPHGWKGAAKPHGAVFTRLFRGAVRRNHTGSNTWRVPKKDDG